MTKKLLLFPAIVIMMLVCLCSCTPDGYKVFSDVGYKITLPEEATQTVYPTHTVYTIGRTKLKISYTVPFSKEYNSTKHISEIFDRAWDNGFEAALKQDSGIAYVEYTDEAFHPELYSLIVPVSSNDDYWELEFQCDVNLKDEYKPIFLRWSQYMKL